MSPMVFEPSRRRVARGFAIMFGMTSLCVALAFWGPMGLKTLVLGVVGIPVMGAWAVFYGSRLVRPGPELTITDEGFDHRLWGRVSWSEVAAVEIRVRRVKGQQYPWVEVVLKDPGRTFSHLRRGGRLFALVNRTGRHVSIAANTFPASAEEVLSAMQEAHQRFLGLDPVAALSGPEAVLDEAQTAGWLNRPEDDERQPVRGDLRTGDRRGADSGP